ncbi:type I restriction enzyme, S subunit [Aneurinibacillus thermoaerophilus]|uniref:Type I restriction enzyme, S subunit n=1 Tax=Aneurinibacillus thermoaerophilus TaxID=143495 RepID=A0A1G8AKY2_ANETH|nr:restriction endonuclease subunit S [Aneurinibacillus thermoaerophilus]SDH21675.1 type I restriction enzyme, S subunit [Aneurinibacillus thermoaerophilus]
MSFNKKKDTLLGQIPDDWEIFSVQELVDMDILEKPMDGNHGSLHPVNKDFVNNGIPFIMASDIKNGKIDYSSCKFLSEETSKKLKKGFAVEGDVLLTHKATIGRTAIVKNILTQYIMLTPQVTYYRVKNLRELDNKFLKYYFDWDNFQNLLHSWSNSGSTRAYIGITAQRKLPILLPKIKDQKFIVNILSTLDEKIETNNQINEKLEEMAQALFKHWFVDFEFPNENGEPYKSSGGEMVESELGMIPKGWNVVTLEKIAELIMGLSPKSSTYNEDGIGLPLLNGAADFDKNNLRPSRFTSDPKRVSKKEDWLLCIRGTIGNLTFSDGDYALGRGVAAIRAKESMYREIIYFNLQKSIKELISLASGSVISGLSKQDINNLKIITPDKKILTVFHNLIHKIQQEQIDLKSQNKVLSKIRDILLPKLMSGEIRVPLDNETLVEQS